MKTVYGVVPNGIHGILTEIEVDVSGGLPGFYIVGLPDTAITESRERIRAAIKNSGFKFPARRITVNLAPAAIRKMGACLDLPIAVGILLATQQLTVIHNIESLAIFYGELSLNGSVKYNSGNLQAANTARKEGFKYFLTHHAGCLEAAHITSIQCVAVASLGDIQLEQDNFTRVEREDYNSEKNEKETPLLPLIKGQHQAKRCLEIAAAGRHNLLLCGPPGCGKTLLCRAMPELLPPLTLDESIELTEIYSARGLHPDPGKLVEERPFRAPHHTISDVGLIGGGSTPRPGEVTLAHHGILFLDEMAEFSRRHLDLLRQPLSNGEVLVSRAQKSCHFPARFLLLAAINPCPCGKRDEENESCRCSSNQKKRYLSRISGPILDRIDISLKMSPVGSRELLSDKNESALAKQIRERISQARECQKIRFAGQNKITMNGDIPGGQTEKYCQLNRRQRQLVEKAMDHFCLSARTVEKLLKIALTIKDLEGSERVQDAFLLEAINLATWSPMKSLENL